MLKKFFAAFAIALLLLAGSTDVASAEIQELSADGEYRLGDRDNREDAKTVALADARRKIVEQIGIKVESYSEVNNFKLTTDQIRTAANALIRIKKEDVDFVENGTVCKAHIIATIDTDEIARIVNNPAPTPIDDNFINGKDDNLLRVAGFVEFNGHYYKLYDEDANWLQARERCERMGGHLVSINSSAEQDIVQILMSSKGNRNNYWIGGFRKLPNEDDWVRSIVPKNFIWVTGEEVIYSNWAKNQPDYNDKVENVMMIWKSNGLWNDIIFTGEAGRDYGSKNFGFICEWESYENIKKYS